MRPPFFRVFQALFHDLLEFVKTLRALGEGCFGLLVGLVGGLVFGRSFFWISVLVVPATLRRIVGSVRAPMRLAKGTVLVGFGLFWDPSGSGVIHFALILWGFFGGTSGLKFILREFRALLDCLEDRQ